MKHEVINGKPTRIRRGLTLTEILVVIAILAVIASLLAVNYNAIFGSAKHKIAEQEVAKLKEIIEQYKIITGNYPNSTDGLAALTQPLAGSTEPLLNGDKVNDPWSHPYIYVAPGLHGKFDLTCLGADGVEGGIGENADIHSWDSSNPQSPQSPTTP